MKIMVVSEISLGEGDSHQETSGFHIFEYWHPLKAMDNLDEIAPEAVVWNVTDFPRHWKAALQLFLQLPGRSSDNFALVHSALIEEDEIKKIDYLGLKASSSLDELATGFSRWLAHRFPRDNRANTAISKDDDSQGATLLWTHPKSGKLCMNNSWVHGGSMLTIQHDLDRSPFADLVGTVIARTSLLVDQQMTHPSVKVSSIEGSHTNLVILL